MRELLCLLAIAGASVATLGCSSEPAATPAANTDTDLGEAGSMDEGNTDSAGSTTN